MFPCFFLTELEVWTPSPSPSLAWPWPVCLAGWLGELVAEQLRDALVAGHVHRLWPCGHAFRLDQVTPQTPQTPCHEKSCDAKLQGQAKSLGTAAWRGKLYRQHSRHLSEIKQCGMCPNVVIVDQSGTVVQFTKGSVSFHPAEALAVQPRSRDLDHSTSKVSLFPGRRISGPFKAKHRAVLYSVNVTNKTGRFVKLQGSFCNSKMVGHFCHVQDEGGGPKRVEPFTAGAEESHAAQVQAAGGGATSGCLHSAAAASWLQKSEATFEKHGWFRFYRFFL